MLLTICVSLCLALWYIFTEVDNHLSLFQPTIMMIYCLFFLFGLDFGKELHLITYIVTFQVFILLAVFHISSSYRYKHLHIVL